ncbi:phage terminase large subunit family protein [Shinella zoogloeoides]
MSYPALTSAGQAKLRERLTISRQKGLTPPPKLNLVEWADANRYLSPEASSSPGRWRTSNVEVARGPMLAATDPRIHTVTIMCCTQLMKTELLNNVVGFYIHQDPAPIILIQPTTKLGESWSKDRFDKMRRDTPVIKERVREARSKDSGTTILHKDFDGGHLTIVGANSPVDLASRPIRVVLADEVDKYPASAGKEGDPLSLAEERAASFWNRKFIRACSPTISGNSKIESEYEASDQRKPFLACPHCDARQVLEFERVRWDKSDDGEHLPNTARYHCIDCDKPWDETVRQRMLRTPHAIQWRQTAQFMCCGHEQTPSKWDDEGHSLCEHCGKRSLFEGHAGFWASKLYSPWGGLDDVARKWLKATKSKNSELLKTFYNTQLGLPFQITGDAPEWRKLYDRRDHHSIGTVPKGACFLTAGIDVQRDRIEMHVWGWGRGLESWLVDVVVVEGVVADIGGQVWKDLAAALKRTWPHESGARLPIIRAAIDTGDGLTTSVVYEWCRLQGKGQVVAIKGDREKLNAVSPVDGPKWMDVTVSGRKIKRGLALYMVSGPFFKQELYRYLRLEKPTDEDVAVGVCFPDGYVHIPQGATGEWVEQLVAEQLVTEKNKVTGFGKLRWVKTRERNEALDCRVYARSMVWHLGADRWSSSQWYKLEVQCGAETAKSAPPPATTPDQSSPTAAANDNAPRPKPRKAASTWL